MSSFMANTIDDLVALHNDARRNKWLWKASPLVKNDKLMLYAQNWANKMASGKGLVHSSMKDIMSLGFSSVAENIAVGQKSTEEVMRTWLNSSGHKRNILNGSFTDIGCGMSLSSSGKLFWCVCFGKI